MFYLTNSSVYGILISVSDRSSIMKARSYDFFISYNSADVEQAKRISAVIKSNGLTCWWQKENSRQEYALEIKAALNASDTFIVLLSGSSAASEWVGREILAAIRLYSEKHTKILPIVVGELEKKDYDYFYHLLGMFNWLFLDKIADNKELIRAITTQVGIKLKEKSTNSIYSAAEQIERERLQKQNKLYNRYAKAAIDEVFAEFESPSVLDVGCFDAKNIMSRLEGRSFSRLLCVDKDTDALKEASERLAGDERITFMHADITKKTFIEKLKDYLAENSMDGFDFIHISAVLLHIKNPRELLKSLREVLSEKGYILVQDEDDGFNTAFQEDNDEPSFFSDCFYIWRYSKESGDRFFARKLPIFLKSAGYSDIKLSSCAMTSVDFNGELKEELWDMYFNSDYWVVDSPEYFSKDDAFDKYLDYKLDHAKMKAKYMRGHTFISIGVLIFTARK